MQRCSSKKKLYTSVVHEHSLKETNTVVPAMNGHPRDQAKVSVHCRWPLIRGMDGHVEMSRDIDNVAVHIRWPLTTGVAQGRYYCNVKYYCICLSNVMKNES